MNALVKNFDVESRPDGIPGDWPQCVIGTVGDAVVHEQNRLSSAVHQANTLLRYLNAGQPEAAGAAYDRLEGTVLSSRHPELFLEDLAARLGRVRALAVGIEKPVIDRSLARRR